MNKLKELIKEVEILKKVIRDTHRGLSFAEEAELKGIKQTVETVDKIFMDNPKDIILREYDCLDWDKLKQLLNIK